MEISKEKLIERAEKAQEGNQIKEKSVRRISKHNEIEIWNLKSYLSYKKLINKKNKKPRKEKRK